MQYNVTVNERTDIYRRVTILDTTYSLILDENSKTWGVYDYDECSVSLDTEKRVKNILQAFSII